MDENKEIEKFMNSTMFQAACKILKRGGLVIFPTETVYGLAAVFDNEEAVENIFKVKKRLKNKPLSVLVSNKKQIFEVADADEKLIEKICEKFWPGPLTVVLPKKLEVSDLITAGKKTIGVRMPDNKIALSIIEAVGAPLVTTSVNISGEEPAKTFEEAMEFKDSVELVVDGGKCTLGVPSTVVEINGNEFKILREGNISKEELEKQLF